MTDLSPNGHFVIYQGLSLSQDGKTTYVQSTANDAFPENTDHELHQYIIRAGAPRELTLTASGYSEFSGLSGDGSTLFGWNRSGNCDHIAAMVDVKGGDSDYRALSHDESEVHAASRDGSVLVGSVQRDGINHAALWKHNRMEQLDIPGSSSATAVSANGRVVTGVADRIGFGQQVFRYSRTDGLQYAGSLGGATVTPNAVSRNGQTIVGKADTPSWQSHAFYVGPNQSATDLGTFGGNNSEATGVSANGQLVVGWAALKNGDQHAFIYQPGGKLVDIGTLGGHFSMATAVSADGSTVVGVSSTRSYVEHAFRYSVKDGVMEDLGTLGGDMSAALAVSADGSTIVGSSDTRDQGHGVFVWRQTARQ
ncbi:HAF repeat-containing protein [Paludibacterium sp. THUN1379]|nr:HAF repeat-containing protein [Paludibacterium sp. THUN1379]